jgi:DNA repair protein RecN (Recombination protein N)
VLTRLVIENVGLIERAELEPAAGLNVISGETGAGKTMLAQAIGLLAGSVPSSGMVGPHGDEAYVEAEFTVPAGFFDDPALTAVSDLRPQGEADLVVARRLLASGRSRALVWGRSCARGDLEALAERLIEVSSQHEARRLAQPLRQLALLDAFAGGGAALERMAGAWAQLRAARAEVERARARQLEAARRRGELEALVEDVDAAGLESGERDRLALERERLRHLDDLTAAIAGAAELLNPDDGDGALSLTGRAGDLVEQAERYQPELGAVAADLRDASVRIQEAAVELRTRLQELDVDPGRLEQVEQRLQLLADLERRHGELDRLGARADEARAALAELDAGGGRIEQLERAEAEAADRARGCSDQLRKLRRKAAPALGRAVEAELAQLGMAGAAFRVVLEPAELSAHGSDRVVLELAANPGLPAGPLADVGSGGELSRVALALRVAARAPGGPGVLLLDEVDAGVGGRTARAVGEKLQELSLSAQVLCITHLPQIASLADANFHVAKELGDPSTATIVRLEGEQVVDELARMLGGEAGDDAARAHAASLRG